MIHMLVSSTLGLALAALFATSARGPETDAERYHRKGVHCMEVIERTDCAIENFEALMDETTNRRDLVSDAMLRLIRLYRAAGTPEASKPLLRKFWDAGMKLDSRGHVPHSTRYMPADFDVIVNVDVARVVDAPLTRNLGADARDTFFTCDESRRKDLEDKRRWNRAKRKAEREKRDFKVVLYEEVERERKREADRAKQAAKTGRDEPPVFADASCPLARALGQDDLVGWRRMTGLFDHAKFVRSAMLVELDKLDDSLTLAVADGRLVEIGRGRWTIPGLVYDGRAVHVAKLDVGELVVGPPDVVTEVIDARARRDRTIDRTFERLIQKVPRGTGFFVVLTQSAMTDLGLGSLEPAARGFLEAILPKPKGMQIAGVLGDDFGLFTRVPTDNPVKGRMLVQIVRTLID
ncbi:MAG TPA: hypothetical protein VFG69_19835, partial [Nannocystaceae bacterium]|nr:hypothetical protein [Nannocystaceae bacterium]